MASNLLSVNRFCRDNHCAFYFDSDCFHIQDRLTGKPLYKGLSRDGLYPLHGLSLPFRSRPSLSSSFAQAVCLHLARATASASSLWHARFGHPQDRVLRHVLQKSINPSLSITSQFCKHCTQGKMTQLPFSHSNTIASSPLEIVYSDVWGPAPISSINGFRYYVAFIDAYSRFTWFFPLNTNLKCYHILCTSRIPWKIFFELLLKFFAPIVGVNIPKIVFNLFAPLMVFFINLHVLIHHNRMVFLNVNIDT